MPVARTLEFYRDPRGQCPMEMFLDGLSSKDTKKVAWVLRLIGEFDRVPAQYFKKLIGTDGIWECRISSGFNVYRVFAFFFSGERVMLTHGYAKKSMKTDRHEIESAERMRREY